MSERRVIEGRLRVVVQAADEVRSLREAGEIPKDVSIDVLDRAGGKLAIVARRTSLGVVELKPSEADDEGRVVRAAVIAAIARLEGRK